MPANRQGQTLVQLLATTGSNFNDPTPDGSINFGLSTNVGFNFGSTQPNVMVFTITA